MIRDTLGPTLRAMRERAGLSQVALAAKMGMTSATISRAESGANIPPIPTIEAWASVCGRSLTLVEADLSPEAHEAADILEAATPEDRALFLTVLRRMAVRS
jgi:transcriptional regulator with XRE-family HTH domain